MSAKLPKSSSNTLTPPAKKPETEKYKGTHTISPASLLPPYQPLAISSNQFQSKREPIHQKPQPHHNESKMPTPESAAFLAKKPTVAPSYEGVDFEDTAAIHNVRDAIIREQWVRSMMARLVGDELGRCYRREGVNHLEKCGRLRDRYFELLKDAKIKGYLFEEKNYFNKEK